MSRQNNIEEFFPLYALNRNTDNAMYYGKPDYFKPSLLEFVLYCRGRYSGEILHKNGIQLTPYEAHEFLFYGGVENLWESETSKEQSI